MSPEIFSPQEKSTATLLDTDQWYPVMSPVSTYGNEQTTFWISEQPEEFMKPSDQSEAQCYRVDFTPEQHSTSGNSVIGRVATMDTETRIQLLIVGGYGYLGNRDIIEKKQQEKQERETERLLKEVFDSF